MISEILGIEKKDVVVSTSAVTIRRIKAPSDEQIERTT